VGSDEASHADKQSVRASHKKLKQEQAIWHELGRYSQHEPMGASSTLVLTGGVTDGNEHGLKKHHGASYCLVENLAIR
jgi:hypothetical protein